MKINFNKAEFLTSCYDTEKMPEPDKPEVVFVGRSNVGKSSMINKLLNRKSMAYVSSKPGKTAAVNYFVIDSKLYLTDLPGYGFALRSKNERESWGELINSYFDKVRDRRLIVLLTDIRHDPSQDDIAMYNYLMSGNTPFCIAATKADKLSSAKATEARDALSRRFRVRVIPFSSQTGQGVEEIKQIIEDVSGETKND